MRALVSLLRLQNHFVLVHWSGQNQHSLVAHHGRVHACLACIKRLNYQTQSDGKFVLYLQRYGLASIQNRPVGHVAYVR